MSLNPSHSTWAEALNPQLVGRLSQPMTQPGIVSLQPARSVMAYLQYPTNHLPLLLELGQRWRSDELTQANTPIVYLQQPGDIDTQVGEPQNEKSTPGAMENARSITNAKPHSPTANRPNAPAPLPVVRPAAQMSRTSNQELSIQNSTPPANGRPTLASVGQSSATPAIIQRKAMPGASNPVGTPSRQFGSAAAPKASEHAPVVQPITRRGALPTEKAFAAFTEYPAPSLLIPDSLPSFVIQPPMLLSTLPVVRPDSKEELAPQIWPTPQPELPEKMLAEPSPIPIIKVAHLARRSNDGRRAPAALPVVRINIGRRAGSSSGLSMPGFSKLPLAGTERRADPPPTPAPASIASAPTTPPALTAGSKWAGKAPGPMSPQPARSPQANVPQLPAPLKQDSINNPPPPEIDLNALADKVQRKLRRDLARDIEIERERRGRLKWR